MKEKRITSLWKNRTLILEGIKNSVFVSEAVEEIAEVRNKICKKCPFYDEEGIHCMVPHTNPCCGSCGCSLHLKQRSLASGCDEGYWDPVLTEEEDLNHLELKPEDHA